MFGDPSHRSERKVHVQIERRGRANSDVYIFLNTDERIVDTLNDEHRYIPVEDCLGRVLIIAKDDIVEIVPLEARDTSVGLASIDPYLVLGVSKGDSDQDIRTAYNALLSVMHSDKVQAAGLHERLAHLASEQTQCIVAAFREIVRIRGGDGGAATGEN